MTIQGSAMVAIFSSSYEPSFQEEHRKGLAFTRTRKLTFPILVGMILRMVKTSIQITCNWLRDSMESELIIPWLQKKDFGKDTVLLAVMDQRLGFRSLRSLAKEFRRWKTRENVAESHPMARISEYTDMTTKLILSGRIARCKILEDELSREQLDEVVLTMRKYGQEKMLFVYDRGYPCEEFIQQHLNLGVDFLFRVPKNFNRSVKKSIVYYTLSGASI